MAVPSRDREIDVEDSGARRPRRLTLVLFAILPVALLVLVAETVIRVTGAADTCAAPALEKSALWECDPILHFRTKRTLEIFGRRVNSLGFRAPEFGPKREGVLRVLALGDSCTLGWIARSAETTFFIETPYPDLLQRALNDVRPAEVLNAGVSGYNSYHGLMLLRTKLRGLDPDVITVRFGWNDALAAGVKGDTIREPQTAIGRAAESILLRTALFPFAKRLSTALHAPPAEPKGTMPEVPSEWSPVVPIEQYKRNLRRIVEEGRAQGAQVWLLTAPHAFLLDEYRGQEASLAKTAGAGLFLVGFSGIQSFEQLVSIREAYNAATEEIGRELGAPVVDLVATYRAHAAEHLFHPHDVIHPSQRGHELEAETLFTRMREEGLVKP